MQVNYRNAQGWLTQAEREHLYQLARAVPSGGVIYNVGIEYGASLVCLHEGSPFARIIAIDLIGTDKLQTPIGSALVVVKGDSRALGPCLGYARAHLAFIDGGHDYSTALDDAMNFGETIKAGGVIAFHDTAHSPAQDEVNRAVEDWLRYQSKFFDELPQVDSIRAFRRTSYPPSVG